MKLEKMASLPINSIYKAVEGEGVFLGAPQVFIRLQGCAVGCLNCDSKYTWKFIKPNYTVDQVLSETLNISSKSNIKRVSITGGDPLHLAFENQLIELLKLLRSKNFFINIEAAGTRYSAGIFNLVDYISMDFKPASTGVKFNTDTIKKTIRDFTNQLQIKTVVSSQEDFFQVLNLLKECDSSFGNWVITPEWKEGEEINKRLVRDIIELNYQNGSHFKIICQQHKFIFDSTNRYV